MSRWLVAVNRQAGSRAVDPAEVSGILVHLGIDATMTVPDGRKEMTESLLGAARDGFDHFAVVGGDGTVNLAVNALLGLDWDQPPVLGVLPAGTGCDLLRTFGIPQDLSSAARHLCGDQTYAIDVGVLEGEWGRRLFVNVAQTGAGAAAAQTAPRLPRLMGRSRYPLAFAVRLPRFPRAMVTVRTERRTVESEGLAVIMANAQFFAGGWNVAPKATMVDGVLDVQMISARKRQAPALVPKIVKGTHLRDRTVRRISSARFEVVTDPVWPVEADGDLIGNTPLRASVLPAAIRLKI